MRTVHAKVETWTYERLLESITPQLLEADPWGAFALLEGLLDRALDSGRDKPPFDGSTVWYRDLAEEPDHPAFSVEEVLTQYLRNAALKLASVSERDLRDVVARLSNGNWTIFRRLALHVSRAQPDVDPEILRMHLLDREALSGTALWPEYGSLLREKFVQLPPNAQATVVSWIEEGPEAHRMAKWDRSEDEILRLANDWRLRRLSLIASHLPEGARATYERLVESFGSMEDPEHHIGKMQSWVGPTSPKRASDLQQMDVSEVIEFLRGWEPPGGWAADTPEGLARELAADVKSRPNQYATRAESLQSVDPTYVRGFVQGLRDAAKDSLSLDWDPVLNLCAWVLEQPRELSTRESDEDRDTGWLWTRKAIASLLSSALSAKAVDIALREKVWPIIEALSDDPEPTPEYEARYGGDNMDPPTLAINTVRGEAFHAIVHYALWVHREWEALGKTTGDGFDKMPEIRARLQRALIVQDEPSAAIRSVFGQFFPWLVLLDEAWAAANSIAIFKDATSGPNLGSAAWDAYLRFCRPFNNVLPILRWRYESALEALDPTRSEVGPDDPDVELGEHLIIYYVRDLVTLEDVIGYFRRASSPVAAAAVGFVGRWLMNGGEWPPEPVERLTTLWENLADGRVLQLNAAAFPEFGWWVSSKVLDPAWALGQAQVAVERGSALEGGHFLAEAVERMASTHLREAVSTLRAVLRHDKSEWGLISWREPGAQILRRAFVEGDGETKQAADEVASLFVARGYVEFQRLDVESGEAEPG